MIEKMLMAGLGSEWMLNKTNLIFLGIGIGVIALVVGVINLGVTLADVTDLLNLVENN